jgi:hypothetical protein
LRFNAALMLQVLLLCDFDPFNAGMMKDSVRLLAQTSAHQVHVLSFRGELPPELDLEAFDVILVHYSTFIYEERWLSTSARQRIAAASATKAVFLQDEYKHVDRTVDALAALQTDVLFTCFEPPQAAQVYADPRLRGMTLVTVLTGYVPPYLAELQGGPPIATRPIDIGYRGRHYPAWHGRLGHERVAIATRVAKDAPHFGLVVDVSLAEKDRLYGAAWLEFHFRCKAVLGTESGASVIDFTGDIARKVDADAARDPDITFETLRARHFADEEDKIPLAVISPRLFEAIACGCALILYPGRYSGRLVAGRHYLMLARDHSNMAEICTALRDPEALSAMVQRTRKEVLLAPENQDSALVQVFDAALADAVGRNKSSRSAARRAPLDNRQKTPAYDPEAFIARFGRYDSPLRLPVIKREVLKLVLRAYHATAVCLPPHLENALKARLRLTWRRLRRY